MATIDNAGHEVVDLPPSAYYYSDVPPFVPRVPMTPQQWQAFGDWRYGTRVQARMADPRAFVRITVC